MQRLVGLLLLACTLLHSPFTSAAQKERVVAVVNGSPIAENRYPALTALVSGREANIIVNNRRLIGHYFGHGVHGSFSGELVGCGFATDVCQNVSGNICLIVATSSNDANGLSPAQQLNNCSLGGGIGALFRSNESTFPRTELSDGNATIPAVFINDIWSRSDLNFLLSANNTQINASPRTSNTIVCGAAYLGKPWLITAAHCLHEQTPDGLRQKKPWEVQAIVGAHNLQDDEEHVQSVSEIHFNNFQTNGVGSSNDIALLRLTEPVRDALANALISDNAFDWREVKIASAETINGQSLQSSEALVLGWGSTAIREPLTAPPTRNSTSLEPLSAVLTLNPFTQCRQQWQDFFQANNLPTNAVAIDNNHLCASDLVSQRDTCQGDSGGPLLIEVDGELQLAGITSFGLGCGSSIGVPGVYTRVSSYSKWIEDTIQTPRIENDGLVVAPSGASSFTGSAASFTGGGSFGFSLLLLGLLKRRMLLLLLPSVVVACNNNSVTKPVVDNMNSPAKPSTMPPNQQLEQIDFVVANNAKLRVQVLSNGCTRAEHFTVTRDASLNCTVSVKRRQPDFCKMATHPVQLDLVLPLPPGCVADEIRISNPSLVN